MSITDFAAESRGAFLVRATSGALHVLEIDNGTIWRTAPPDPSDGTLFGQDGEELAPLRIMGCRKGLPLCVLVDLRIPTVFFTRQQTTPIFSIERVELLSHYARGHRSDRGLPVLSSVPGPGPESLIASTR